MYEIVKQIIGDVLNLDLSSYSYDEISPKNLAEWDSVKHLMLVIALEEEFDIIIEPEDITDMGNGLNEIISILKKHGVE